MKLCWKTCFRVGISVLLVYLCIHYIENVQEFLLKAVSAAAPIFIGCAIAYVVNILMVYYERHFFPAVKKKNTLKLKRIICIIAAYVSFGAIVALVVSLVLPEFLSCIELVITQMPKAYEIVVGFLDDHGAVSQKVIDELSKLSWLREPGKFIEMATGYFGNVMNIFLNVVTTFFSGVVSAVLSVIFSVYLLLSKDSLKKNFNRLMDAYLRSSICEKIRYVASILDESFHNFFVGQTAEAVILGVLCTLGMLVLRLPYATMIGALVAFTALIPVVGAFFGAAVGAFMIAMVSPFDALVFLIFIIVLQQLEGNFIYPKVVGSSIGLPAIWVLAAVTIGGGVLGVLGMLLGVPLAATVYKIVKQDVLKKPCCAGGVPAPEENVNSDEK